MCGGVRFEVTEKPLSAGYCHCTRCQRRTGTAASAQARLAPGSFRLLAGEELVRTYTPEDGWAKSFCSNCGSALWSHFPETGEVGSVRLGFEVRVDLVRDDGERIHVQLTRNEAEVLELAPGDIVYVRTRVERTFVTESGEPTRPVPA